MVILTHNNKQNVKLDKIQSLMASPFLSVGFFFRLEGRMITSFQNLVSPVGGQ